jgi:cyanuric acid amidohydrolase
VTVIRAFTLETRGPADVAGLSALLEQQVIHAEHILCIIGKTEGNGGRNDFTRELAMNALEHLLAPLLGLLPEKVQDHVIFSFSGGTEGVVTPHMIVFTKEGAPSLTRRATKRLCAGIGMTRPLRPDEIGRMAQIEETARAVREIIASMQLDGPEDVHLVQMKGAIPHFTHDEAAAAQRAGRGLTCDMVYSRAASALGVALALGEIPHDRLADDVVCRDWSLYSGVASCSAKPGLQRTELLVFGNSAFWDGDLVIEHGILEDILDVNGIHAVAAKLGATGDLLSDRLIGAFAKSEADPRGSVRGRRHTMLTDDDISDTRYSRCVLSSVLAATLGDTRVYVSTRAEHHGPLGGGPLAIIARAK